MSRSDKAAIAGDATEVPDAWSFEAVPLFWLESKPLEFYEAVIGNYNLVDVQDLSPGSGCLAVVTIKEWCCQFVPMFACRVTGNCTG